jgi:H+/Cl- antiporter ClcA
VTDFFLLIGATFGLLAAAMAYLITLKEWEHHYPTRDIPRRMASKAAIFTFIFFLGASLFIGYVLLQWVAR